jgi:hypothetical protein
MSLPLHEEADKLTEHGFLVIPLCNGVPKKGVEYSKRRDILASEDERGQWFSDKKVNGIAIGINKKEFAIDTDGEYCENLLVNEGIRHLPNELQDLVKRTMYTKTPSGGYHRVFKINRDDFPDGVETKKYISEPGHNEISVIGKEHILRERSAEHKVINDVECLVTLNKAQVTELFKMLSKLNELNTINKVADLLAPYYYQPHRDNIVFTYSGFLHKNKTPLFVAESIVICLANLTKYYDEDIEKSLKVIRDKYSRDPDTDKVSGYQAFLQALDDAYPHKDKIGNSNGNGNGNNNGDSNVPPPNETISGIQAALSKAGLISEYTKSAAGASNSTDDNGIPDSVLGETEVMDELGKHQYYACIRRYHPVRFVIAHAIDKQIVAAIVNYEERFSGFNANGERITKKVACLAITDNIINAKPTDVTINYNPLTKFKEYTITFVSNATRRPIIIGPCPNLEAILEELSIQNLIIKQAAALDALRSIIYRFEVLGTAKITEEVQAPGFYYLDGEIRGYSIYQNPFDINAPDTPSKITACINTIETLYQDYHKPKGKNHIDRLATTLLWGVVSPFSFIKKSYSSKNMELILRYIFDYGEPDSGKTDSVLPVFGMWNINQLDVIDKFTHSYTSANTEARLGHILSLTTYPQMVDEVDASLGDFRNTRLVNMLKASIIQKISRTILNKSRNQPSIPYHALSPLILISNDSPPKDSAFRKRIIPQEHLKSDLIKDPEEMKKFSRWMNDKIGNLAIFGDFIWYYIQHHPEGADFVIKRPWIEVSHELFREFYKLVGKDVPSWIKNHEIKTSQEVMQEVSQLNKHQLISFFQNVIDRAHHDSIYRDSSKGIQETLEMRLNHCLDNDLIQFIKVYNQKNGTQKLVIKQGFVFAMTEWMSRKSGAATPINLNSLTEYLPNFKYAGVPTTKGSNHRDKVVIGDIKDFSDFVNDELNISNAETDNEIMD